MGKICKNLIISILVALCIATPLECFAFDNNDDIATVELAPLNENTEISAIGDAVKIPVRVVRGFHYGDKTVGETLVSIKDASWCGGYFDAAVGNTYTVSFMSAWKTAIPYIFLCDGSNTIKQVINAEKASDINKITFTVTDETVVKVFVRSFGDPSKITATQRIDLNSSIDMELIENMKLNIVTPNKYSAWPLIGAVNGKLVCLYTVADQHIATETSLYMKTSSTNGLTWSEPIEILTEKTAKVKGYTGVGNDSEGNLLIWYRAGGTHELYKTDGTTLTQVFVPDFALNGAHVGNIFTVPDHGLFAFYNTYGDQRSWGVLKSVDDGLTWEKIPVEENIDKSECPAEIDGVYLGEGKILALGRKDASGGTSAMFQMQSSDYGNTWTKEYTNITDAFGSSPSMLLNSQNGIISLYYLQRSSGKLKLRQSAYADVWDAPLNWSSFEVITSENATGIDTGNVKTVAIDGMHLAIYYAGTSSETGVYGVYINPEERPMETDDKTLDLDILNGYHYGDPVPGDTIQISENASWSCTSFDAEYGKKYTVGFQSAWITTVPYIYFCDSSDVVVKVLNSEVADTRNEITFTVDDETVTKIYVRSNSTDDSITATLLQHIAHTYGNVFESDGDKHWQVCEVCNEPSEKTAHKYDNGCDTACNDCGYARAITHTWSNTWSTDGTNHWKECECGDKADIGTHIGGNATCQEKKQCSTCGLRYGEFAACDYVEAVDAKYLKSAATCTAKAVYYKSCSVCGEASTDETFETGSVNNDNHSYINGICKECGTADPNYRPSSPETDDDNTITSIFKALFAVAGIAIAGNMVYRKRRKFIN